jgi:hypothetical protein
MRRPHILVAHVSKSTYLFPVSWEIKYTPYIVNTHYISCGGGGKPPQSASLHSRGNISVESSDQAQEQSQPLQHTVDSKPFVIFSPKILLHIVCIFNIFTAD